MDNLINKKSNSILETDTMKIDKNIIKIRDRTFQISNISSVSVYDKEKLKYPQWAIIAVVAGIIVMTANVIVGLVAIVIGGSALASVFSENSTPALP